MKITELYPDVITEDLNYELKTVLSQDNPLKWAKTIVGFANGEGGIIFVGVNDNRDAFGLSIEEIDKTKNLVVQINDRHIFPHAKYAFSMRSVDNDAERFILAIKVFPSDSVVRYRDGDFNETVYVKGDGYTTPASPEEIVSLSRKKHGVDNSVSDVPYDKKEWSRYLTVCGQYRKNNSLPDEKELQNEQIVSKDGYATTGLLMFKNDYNDPDSMITCRLWRGSNKAGEVLDTGRYTGPLLDVFDNALTFIERNTKIGWKKTSEGGREEIRSYPREAVREVLVNAIAHRDYSIMGTQIDVDIYQDRIEVVSPGSWLLPKPYEQYPVGSIPSIRRNQTIAACLDVANLMERGGTGFQTIAGSYTQAEPEKQPIVASYPGFLKLTLFDLLYGNSTDNENLADFDAVIEEDESVTEDQRKIVQLLRDGPMAPKELQEASSYQSRGSFLKYVINPLLADNKIRKGAKGGRLTTYELVNKSES